MSDLMNAIPSQQQLTTQENSYQLNHMKTVISTFAMAITIVAGSYAQSAQLKIKSKDGDIPVAVVESFKKDFKDVTAAEWAVVPVRFASDDYVVSGFNHLNDAEPSGYTVVMKGHGINGQALYNKSGDLIYLKEYINNTALPAAVTNAVLAKYPGYAIVKDQETVMEGKTNLIHYKVTIHKGNDERVLAVDAGGKILRERK
ncbi:MAG TPA: hypothetical protein VK658_07945 [Chryseolinea sp.]|nr:hypothetical protein [Chryseolinea sp.]